FTRLGSLRHFDLQLIGICQVVAGYAKPSGSNLLDGRALPVSIFFFLKSYFVFSTFTAVTLSADAVHGNSQGSVCFIRDGTKGHRPGSEALEDFFSRLNFF